MNFYQKGRQVIDLFAFFFEKNFLNNTLTPEGIVKRNDPYLYGEKVKAYLHLQRGAKKEPKRSQRRTEKVLKEKRLFYLAV